MNKDKAEEKRAEIAVLKDEHHILKSGEKYTDLRKQAVIKQTLDLQHDLEKPKEDVGFDKMQTSKQHSKDPKAEPKQEKSGEGKFSKSSNKSYIIFATRISDMSLFSFLYSLVRSASSVHVPLTVGTWPGGFPPYGQVIDLVFFELFGFGF